MASHGKQSQTKQETKRKPFAFEICPWHSQGFNLTPKQIDSLAGYITQFVLEPAEEIAKGSTLPFIISVGKDYQKLFEALDFQKEFAVGPDNYKQYQVQYPLKKDGSAVIRYYSVWRSHSGGIYLNTYSPGSNKNPQAGFQDAESFIINKIYNLLGDPQSLHQKDTTKNPDSPTKASPPLKTTTPSIQAVKLNGSNMKNIEGIRLIREAVEREITRNGWTFSTFPKKHGKEGVLYIRKKDLPRASATAPESRQLIEGGKNINPFGSGSFDNLQEHINFALEQLRLYAKSCGV